MITFMARGVPNAYRDRMRLRAWLERVAKGHGHGINDLAFVLMSDAELRSYNRRYLGHDYHTDVITFDGQTGTGLSGDVLMSIHRIRYNAKHYGVPIQQELRRVMVHGLLHLLGHTDSTDGERAAMKAQEDKWLMLY